MRAAFDAAREAGLAEEVGAQLERVQSLVQDTPELMRLLRHPAMSMPRKLGAVADLLAEEPLPVMNKLLEMVVEHDRGEVLQVAGEVYREVADEARGVVRAKVTTALPLHGEQAARLRGALVRWLNAEVVLEEEIAPDIIGGVRIEIGDRVIDGSLRGRLERIKASVTAG